MSIVCSTMTTDAAAPMSDCAKTGEWLAQPLESDMDSKTRPIALPTLSSIIPRQHRALGRSVSHSGSFRPTKSDLKNLIQLMGFMVGQINDEATFPIKINILRGISGSP